MQPAVVRQFRKGHWGAGLKEPYLHTQALVAGSQAGVRQLTGMYN